MTYLISNHPDQDDFGLERISLEECVERLSSCSIISVDVETSGLSPIDDQLLMVQISTEDGDDYVIDARGLDLSPLNAIMQNKDIIKLLHNAQFDYKFLKANGVTLENVYDTMLVSKVLLCGIKNAAHSLAAVLKRVLKIEMDKEERNSFICMGAEPFTKEQMVYGIEDTRHLFAIRIRQKPHIAKWRLGKVVDLENEVVLAFADISLNGMYLNQDKWEDKAEIAYDNLQAILPEMDAMLVEMFPEYATSQHELFEEGRKSDINWNSPKQVLEVFSRIHPELTSVGADVISHFTDPLIKLYKRYKEQAKLYNAYGIAYYKYLHSDGKVHTNFNQVLNTFRVSSSNPNTQQILGDYRECFEPKNDGWVYVSADYASQELAVIAFGAKEHVWLDAIRNGRDLHSACAAVIFGEQWTSLHDDPEKIKDTPEGKRMRTACKALSFGLAYGMGTQGLANRLEITEQQAQVIMDKYFYAFPSIKNFLEALGRYGKNNGHIKTYAPYRGIRFFPEWEGPRTQGIGKIIRASKNTPIQGTSALMTKRALVLLRDAVKELPYEVEVVAQIHDEIACVCHEDNAKAFAPILQRCMEEAADEVLEPGLLKAEPEISAHWSK